MFNIPESVFNIPGIRVQLRAESVFKILRNTHHLRRDWKGRDFLVSGACIQIVSERFKCAYVAADNGSGAFEAVVIPSPPVADLESLVATLNAVPDIALAVVSALSYVHLGSDAKGSNSRHRRPPALRARRYW